MNANKILARRADRSPAILCNQDSRDKSRSVYVRMYMYIRSHKSAGRIIKEKVNCGALGVLGNVCVCVRLYIFRRGIIKSGPIKNRQHAVSTDMYIAIVCGI